MGKENLCLQVVWVCSVVSDSSAIPGTDCSPLSSSVIGFSRQEYWSGLPFPSLGHLPDPGIKPGSSALQADSALQAQYIRSFPPSIVRIYHCLFICPTTDEHLWCFHLGTIMNKDMMNILILSFYSFLLGIYLQVELLDH